MDLVKLQIHVAAGGRLEGERPAEDGHAIEARLNAEDPDRDFAPAPGRITRLDLPAGPGIRVDTGVSEGTTIPADFDSMIAKIIAWGRDRNEALARLRRAMGDTTVVIEGGASNKSFVLDLLDQPEILRGDPVWADTGWIDRVRAEGRLAAATGAGAALVTAGIRIYVEELARSVRRLIDTARGGRPQVQHEAGRPGRPQAARHHLPGHDPAGRPRPLPGRRCAPAPSDPVEVEARWELIDDTVARLEVNGVRHRVVAATHGPSQFIEVDGVAHRVSVDEGGVLRAPAPALVVATPVAAGSRGAGGRPRPGAGVDEDGDRAARAVRRTGQGAGGHHRQPGGDRGAAGQARAARHRRGAAGGAVQGSLADLGLPPAVVAGPARPPPSRSWPTWPPPCSATTTTSRR